MSHHAGIISVHHGHDSSVSLFHQDFGKHVHFSQAFDHWEWLVPPRRPGDYEYPSFLGTLIMASFENGLKHARHEGRAELSHDIVPIRGTLVLSGPGPGVVRVFTASRAPAANSYQLHYARITFDDAKDDSCEISRWCHAVRADIELMTLHSVPPNAFDMKLETIPPEHRPDLMAFLNLHDHHTEPHAVEEQLGSLRLGADTAWLDSDDDSVLPDDDNDDHAQPGSRNTRVTRKITFDTTQYNMMKEAYPGDSIPDPKSRRFKTLVQEIQKKAKGRPCSEAAVLKYYKNRGNKVEKVDLTEHQLRILKDQALVQFTACKEVERLEQLVEDFVGLVRQEAPAGQDFTEQWLRKWVSDTCGRGKKENPLNQLPSKKPKIFTMTGDLKKHVNDVLDRETDTPALRTSLLDMIHEKDANYSMGQLINYISRRNKRLETITAGASSSATGPSAPKPKPQRSRARKINPNGSGKPDHEFLRREWDAYVIEHGASVPLSDENCEAIVASLVKRKGKTSELYEVWVRRYFGTKIERHIKAMHAARTQTSASGSSTGPHLVPSRPKVKKP